MSLSAAGSERPGLPSQAFEAEVPEDTSPSSSLCDVRTRCRVRPAFSEEAPLLRWRRGTASVAVAALMPTGTGSPLPAVPTMPASGAAEHASVAEEAASSE